MNETIDQLMNEMMNEIIVLDILTFMVILEFERKQLKVNNYVYR